MKYSLPILESGEELLLLHVNVLARFMKLIVILIMMDDVLLVIIMLLLPLYVPYVLGRRGN